MVYKNCIVRVASWGLVDSPPMTAECAALVTARGGVAGEQGYLQP